MDGQPHAPSVVSRWRKILNNAVEYAIERKILTTNPLPALKWKPPRTVQAVDRRRVANPAQARALLTAVDTRAPHLVAFYACLYFAALRPEEAAGLTKQNLTLPAEGWGEIHLERAKPHAGSEWTNTGDERDNRQLKQRAIGEIRTVPCPPELTALLHRHIKRFGTTADGRLFVGERNTDHLPVLTVTRTWARAREAVFGHNAGTSHVAARPYDLRHAAVSTWLNAGVPATQVAEWAGHSVDVLLATYAKCIDGDAARNQAKIENALGHGPAR
nr:tyrosine-type recombinase/integrase [Phytoactinopolyspora alkaliphila]